ncbi:nitrile hydratase subunit beta [Limibaculum sp. FT325]|uniref:SH3-like domain-containing protein n=1 Tax=Thermohalobaculum sediminis TaxID=2939436 RepID=UPI0020C16801|nr:SH3-like domain-containing protein [Limibaculum sediminis]MCL5776473.1 nitrile hydratase subunit beta [Limibaculum sediminis]
MQDDFDTGRRWHDMGGLPAGGIDRAGHDFALWEKRVDALVILCGVKGLFSVDGLRRALEDMGPQAFEERTYYERWVQACAQNLVECGAITLEELNARMAEIVARGSTYGEAQGHGETAGDAA